MYTQKVFLKKHVKKKNYIYIYSLHIRRIKRTTRPVYINITAIIHPNPSDSSALISKVTE